MIYKFGEIPTQQFEKEKEYLISCVFKLLPYKQDGYKHLDNYFESTLQRLDGFNKLIGYKPELITVMSLLEHAREENDFSKYRKAILDACGLINVIKDGDIGV